MQSSSDEDWGQDASWEQARLLTQTMHMSLEHVMRLISSGSLDLTPDYLRIGRWEIRRQSRLIESLLLNMPVPPIYLAEESRGRYVIIDGYQRLTAIYRYLNNEFRLQGVGVLPGLRNRSFEELGPEFRTALEMQLITVVTIPRQTSSFVRYEVFLRLNTGGKPLSVQQVRMAAFPGPLNDALIQFSQDDFLWGQLKASARRDMTDVAYVLRFLSMAHMDDPWTHPTQRMLDEFIATHAHDSPDEIDSYREWFQRSIRACEAIWANTLSSATGILDGSIASWQKYTMYK